jgi:hypothetical protein
VKQAKANGIQQPALLPLGASSAGETAAAALGRCSRSRNSFSFVEDWLWMALARGKGPPPRPSASSEAVPLLLAAHIRGTAQLTVLAVPRWPRSRVGASQKRAPIRDSHPPCLGKDLPIGEPDAGNPPVRFGGRGGANQCAIPTSMGALSMPTSLSCSGASRRPKRWPAIALQSGFAAENGRFARRGISAEGRGATYLRLAPVN